MTVRFHYQSWQIHQRYLFIEHGLREKAFSLTNSHNKKLMGVRWSGCGKGGGGVIQYDLATNSLPWNSRSSNSQMVACYLVGRLIIWLNFMENEKIMEMLSANQEKNYFSNMSRKWKDHGNVKCGTKKRTVTIKQQAFWKRRNDGWNISRIWS